MFSLVSFHFLGYVPSLFLSCLWLVRYFGAGSSFTFYFNYLLRILHMFCKQFMLQCYFRVVDFPNTIWLNLNILNKNMNEKFRKIKIHWLEQITSLVCLELKLFWFFNFKQTSFEAWIILSTLVFIDISSICSFLINIIDNIHVLGYMKNILCMTTFLPYLHLRIFW